MLPEKFIQNFDISPEVQEKLEIYHALLLKWQRAINLVSPSTLGEAWHRHFADSAQLVQHIPEGTKILADIGSGAGFPGLVLAIMRPEIEVHLIESDERKAQFLRTVSRETSSGCVVHDVRIEDAYELVKPDLITARALASLKELCAYVLPWVEAGSDVQMLFLKGENAQVEIEAAQAAYNFDLDTHQSVTSKKARIASLQNLAAL